MNIRELEGKLSYGVINGKIKKMDFNEKTWFYSVVLLIVKIFPEIDIYTNHDGAYIGFGNKPKGASKVKELLLVCHFDNKESVARFHICENNNTEELVKKIGLKFDANLTVKDDIEIVKNWLEAIKLNLGDDYNKYIGNGYYPSDYKNDDSVKTAHNNNSKVLSSSIPLNQIFYGPPGTGKTYNTIKMALEILGEEIPEDRKGLKIIFDEKVKSGQIVFTTFHQSMNYEDFIEGIKPILSENESSQINYHIEEGIFKKLADKAKIHPVKQNFVLIIDEINRGNVSQIFGELITLIEEDKRLGNSEALTVTLPYSKESFGVPNNLYIIGTMNTADRSVEALDSALRRRFSFTEMLPDAELLKDKKVAEIELNHLLKTINKRLERLLDRDHQIGHSYLLNVNNEEQLCEAFKNKIIPLLQEFFFNDYAKIGLVLGKGFVEEDENLTQFASFYGNDDTAQDRTIYQLKKLESSNIIKALESTPWTR